VRFSMRWCRGCDSVVSKSASRLEAGDRSKRLKSR
jgi:hypothetical protein